MKEALVYLLQKKNFDSIKTTEICENALVSRNTFYNYYTDKYALLEDCFLDFEKVVSETFEERQKENNPEHDMKKGFLNLIDSFFDMESNYHSISILSNFDLTTLYYRAIMNILEKYEDKYAGFINPDYDFRQLNSFLVLGFWGFIHGNMKLEKEDIRERTRKLILDLLNSPIFRMNSSKPGFREKPGTK